MNRKVLKGTLLGLLVGAMFATSSTAGVTVVPQNEHLKVNTSDIPYRYNYDLKKCEKSSFGLKSLIVDMLRRGEAIIDDKFVNDAGVSYAISYEYAGREYEMSAMDSYGECRLYEDVVIKGIDVKDMKVYRNLKEAKETK